MTDWEPPLTRRQLLGTATAGGLLYGGTSLLTQVSANKPTHTHYTYAQTESDGDDSDGSNPSLRIAWRQEYNGALVSETPDDAHNGTDNWAESPIEIPDRNGPAIDESNILPGDNGSLHVGLTPESDDTNETDEVAAWFRPRLTDVSGLANVIKVELWYDTGFADIGGCDGENGIGDDSISSGTLREVFTATDLSNGARLACLEADERLCLGFTWSLPKTVGNDYQGTGVDFALDFGLTYCEDQTSPFNNGDNT